MSLDVGEQFATIVLQLKSTLGTQKFSLISRIVIGATRECTIHNPGSLLTERFLNEVRNLADPRVAAFVTHCGLGGINEVSNPGKPALVVSENINLTPQIFGTNDK